MGRKRALSRPLYDRSARKCRSVEHPHDSSSPYGVPTLLNLGKPIFLSHSGKDKVFVRILHEQLCNRYHDAVAFFDAETLPKAEPVSMANILEEARGSKLGVLVLTKHFFKHNRNPMLELEALVAGEVPLLPLFFMLSVDQVKDKSRRARWEMRWKKWRNVNDEVINSWRHALDYVTTFSGLEYGKMAAKNYSDYIHEIVNEVTRKIPPPISFAGEGICGKERLCQIVKGMYEECASKRTSNNRTQIASTSASSGVGDESAYTVDVVGIHGFAGLGKSTLCKCLCDSYFADFNGKVCWVDLGSEMPFEETSSQRHSSRAFSMRMQHILSMLTGYNNGGKLSFDQVENVFRVEFSKMKDPIFLAIDNILPDVGSREEADFYLRCGFPKGSKILITSRSRGILENLISPYSSLSAVFHYIPPLKLKEARDIFVGKIPDLCNLEDEVNGCVEMCTFSSIYKWYHPLMVQSLAASIRWNRNWQYLSWKERLIKLRAEGIIHNKNNALEMVFKMLDISYAVLSEEAKTLFLDLALFYSATGEGYKIYEWIWSVYPHNKEKTDEIFCQLEDLCFIEEKSRLIPPDKSGLILPDLLVDFSKYKASQDGNYYVVVEDWLEDPPRTARYVSISRCGYDKVASSTLDLRNMLQDGVLEVLHLVDNSGVQQVLFSRTTFARLCSLIVRVQPGTSLSFIMDEDWSTSSAHAGQPCDLGRPRMWVQIQGNVCFKSLRRSVPAPFDLGIFLRNVGVLTLSHLPSVQSIDVATCANLKHMVLDFLPSLQHIRGLNKSTNLKYLHLYGLPSLEHIRGLDKSTNLQTLHIRRCEERKALHIHSGSSRIAGCRSLERITFCTTLSYPERRRWPLSMVLCPTLSKIDGLLQYHGWVRFVDGHGIRKPVLLEGTFGDLLDNAGIDSSICKARDERLGLSGRGQPGLARLEQLILVDAQHIGLLISGLLEAEHQRLLHLGIHCKEDGDCGCDKNAPHFGPFKSGPLLEYCCPKVRDLASVAEWDLLQVLILRGCTSVEVWPDFANLTALEHLDLSYTPYKVWPDFGDRTSTDNPYTIALLGCWQLSTDEFIKVIIDSHKLPQRQRFTSVSSAFLSLRGDLKAQRRDRCSVVDALYSHCTDLEALFQESNFGIQVFYLVALLYDLWFEEVGANCNLSHTSTCSDCQTKMRRLLCSQSFLSLPFQCHWGQCDILSVDIPHRPNRSSFIPAAPCLPLNRSRWFEMVCGLRTFALVGEASCCIGWDINASVLNDYKLKDRIISFVKWFCNGKYDMLKNVMKHRGSGIERQEWRMLRVRVGDAVCKMARVASVAAELGQEFMDTSCIIQARVQQDQLGEDEETCDGYDKWNADEETTDKFDKWEEDHDEDQVTLDEFRQCTKAMDHILYIDP